MLSNKNGAQKKFRTQENKRRRRKDRALLRAGEEVMSHPKRYGNEWDSPRDGKCYDKTMTKKDLRK